MNLGLLFVLALIISTAILIVSMMATSSMMGGIEFGPAHIVILKGAGLLLLVDGVSLIPGIGIWLTLPIWWFGLMILFGIDFWEARTLVFTNWALNLLVHFALIMMLANRERHGAPPGNEGEDEGNLRSRSRLVYCFPTRPLADGWMGSAGKVG